MHQEIENFLNNDESHDENLADPTNFPDVASFNNWELWLNHIDHEITNDFAIDEGNVPNALFNKSFAKIFRRDLLLIPLWTRILEERIGFGSAGGSTACCENEINKIKNIVFKDVKNKTKRVDSFVKRHIDHLFGEILLANSNFTDVSSDEHLPKDNAMEETENWKGKIISNRRNNKPENEEPEQHKNHDVSGQINKRKRTLLLYLGDQKKIIAKKLSNIHNADVSLLRHSSALDLCSHEIHGITYSLINSCTIDSLAQLFYVAAKDHAAVLNAVSIKECNIWKKKSQ